METAGAIGTIFGRFINLRNYYQQAKESAIYRHYVTVIWIGEASISLYRQKNGNEEVC
jgi:hypothetical protein